MDALALGIVVAIVVWLVMRAARHRQEVLRRAQSAAAPSAGMPRVGTPGTVTEAQLQALRALHFDTDANWSREEAELFLDGVAFLRSALREVAGRREAPEDIQNRLLAFVLTDAELRAAVERWGAARRAQDGAPPSLVQDAAFARLAEYIGTLDFRTRR